MVKYGESSASLFRSELGTAGYSETLVPTYQINGVTSQKITLFIIISV
jgi:hypothetical protein